MKTTIDAAGRLVIPKQIRQQAGLRPGMTLEVRCHDGRIEIEPAPARVRLVRDGPLLVAVYEDEVGEIPADLVETTRQAIEDERFQEIMGCAPLSP
jgi:AbrB family looped-hinge helix DNA binding protein